MMLAYFSLASYLMLAYFSLAHHLIPRNLAIEACESQVVRRKADPQGVKLGCLGLCIYGKANNNYNQQTIT